MNKNATSVILIILAVGIYFTFTSAKIDELKAIREVNAEYQTAIDNSARLIKVRDKVEKDFNNLSANEKDRLNKIIPDNVDNVRLIIDVKDDLAARHGLFLKNIRTSSPPTQPQIGSTNTEKVGKAGTVNLSFSVSTSYEKFIDLLKEMESSLRIMDVTKLSIVPNDNGLYDFSVEVKTYWLRQ